MMIPRSVFLIFLTMILSESFAQTKSGSIQVYPKSFKSVEISHSRGTSMEVYYPSFGDECTLEIVTVGVGGVWGRISGMNGFGDLEKAQRLEFTASDTYEVVAALMFFERPSIVGDGSLNVKVYEVDPDRGGPKALRGFSDAKKVSEVVIPDSVPRATVFTFESGVPVSLDKPRFFVSCDFSTLYGTRDTLVLLQTIQDCGDGADTWELLADGITWGPIISDLSWNLNADFLIGAVVDFDEVTGANSFIANGDLQVHPAYPNPSREYVHLNYTLLKGSLCHIEVYDISGRLIKRTEEEFFQSGRQEKKVSTSDLKPGQYFYRIVTGKESLSSRFIVR